ncbi:MAG: translation initiation factor IF-2 [Scytonematopsis contorta HA4267-MV1]|jgi:translation initiation factor IF-2|nr:translation initiation factor IF-2 [Scytonematopsis contorta HA4267-MV1]
MNNGKVRIYELSKELNLDNKELLAICDQLNIAVKSHSSTITEPEAELIRTEAEKLPPSHANSKRDHLTNGHKPNSSHNGSQNRPVAQQKKQEILEIRKPKILKTANSNSSEAPVANNVAASVSTTSTERTIAAPASPMKPTAPIRPASRNQPENQKEEIGTPAPETVENPANKNPQTDKPSSTKSERSAPGNSPSKRPERQPKPTLSAPPARPAAEAPATPGAPPASPQPSQVIKPVLKKERDQQNVQPERAEQRSEPGQQTGQPREQQGRPKPKQQSPNSGAPGNQTPVPNKVSRPSPVGKGEQKGNRSPVSASEGGPRPSRPVRSSAQPPMAAPVAVPPRLIAPKPPAEATASGDDDTDIPVADDLLLKPKRPILPQKGKGGKKWQEEEIIDEVKANKAAVKNKRLKPMVSSDDDFEDDILDDDEDSADSQAFAISSAIARPPKAKTSSKPSQPQAAPAAPTRGKKPTSRGEQQQRQQQKTQVVQRERPEKLLITGSMTVQELADALVVADTEIVKILFMKGMVVSITQNLDIPTLTLVANELEVQVETQEPEAEARKIIEMLDLEDMDNLQRRPPVVTIMGHVDHGKTTLLDSIRKTKVAAGEAGGITQHIGAYHVDIEHEGKPQQIVFLDTPGHEAFTAMRARGARVTDIAILVVAADDGVRPQTIEAVSHAQAAGVPIIVAINKIDKEGAQPDRVKQELTQYGLTAEEWGGETIMVPVSAIKGENLDTLLEMILLVAEVGELSANPGRAAKGTVIEAHLDKAKGPVATLLVQNGTLHVGDLLVAGSAFGKVRAMVNDRGVRVDIASPSFAVEVLGLGDVPAAGDEFDVFYVEKEARAIASARAEKLRQSRLMQGRVTLTSISAQAQEGELKELNLILKGDVQGSVEAIVGALKQIPQNEVQIRLLLSAAGEVTQTDIDLAAASGAVILGFNTTYASGARQAADEAGVDVREYNIIYKLLEDIQGALEGMLEPELVEEALGQAEVRAVFPVGRGAVAGCYIQNGKLIRNCKLRVHRNGKLIYEGVLDSLRRVREDVREINTGFECGIGVDKFNDWIEGDIIEAYQLVTKRRTLSSTAR